MRQHFILIHLDNFRKEVISSGKRRAGLDSPIAILLQIAVPDFIIAVVVIVVVGCHSKHSCDSMV